MRAVLETLHRAGPMTVPQLARALDITRQGAQRTVTELQRAGHLEAEPNPAHRRSPLYAPTESARQLFNRMHAEELAALEAMADRLTVEEIETARRVLAVLDDGVRDRARRLAEE